MKGYYEIKGQFFFRSVITGFSFFIMFIFIFPACFHWKIFLFYPFLLFLLFCRGGTQIDFAEGFIRHYKNLLGQKIGEWEQLPDIQYIAFHKTTEHYARGLTMSRSSQREVKYKVNLVYDRKEMIQIFSSDDRERSFNVAKEISNESGLRVYITDGKDRPRWLDEEKNDIK